MTDWISQTNRRLQQAKAYADEPETLKFSIFILWLCMRDAEEDVCSTYRSLSEKSLDDAVAGMVLENVFGQFDEKVQTSAAKMKIFESLAIRLRFLEDLFFLTDDAAVSRRASFYEVSFEDEGGFFINRAPKNRLAKGGEPFYRRAFKRARMLPSKIGKYRIDLKVHDDAAGRVRMAAGKPFQLGAAVFDKLEFDLDYDNDNHFVVTSTSCPGHFASLVGGIERASKEDCAGAIYPELTLPSSMIQDLRLALASDQIITDGMSFVVAGSSHEKREDQLYENESVMLDMIGAPIARHKKLYRYSEVGIQERIETGDTITVVLLADRAVSTAICLDYCNIFDNPPFDHLDVDLLIVPSCGGVTTMRRHEDKAKFLYDQSKMKTVVVQQHYDEHNSPAPSDLIGYFLSPVDGGHVRENASSGEPWRRLTL
ncbi:hypothetical protein GB928_027830 [Shinella curvata]|uniref:Uncharacterized protein n=1 Tax=Shinella curvata TaxID=1817964 RepID=A0ABT8XNR2_9HYPH|nr:hypothetical protein [Shinella curvata]MCJ8057154.1 hypothetical protein [Shinella curvata]MDO6124999.1 hypothetical protein [Shinella curvata]